MVRQTKYRKRKRTNFKLQTRRKKGKKKTKSLKFKITRRKSYVRKKRHNVRTRKTSGGKESKKKSKPNKALIDAIKKDAIKTMISLKDAIKTLKSLKDAIKNDMISSKESEESFNSRIIEVGEEDKYQKFIDKTKHSLNELNYKLDEKLDKNNVNISKYDILLSIHYMYELIHDGNKTKEIDLFISNPHSGLTINDVVHMEKYNKEYIEKAIRYVIDDNDEEYIENAIRYVIDYKESYVIDYKNYYKKYKKAINKIYKKAIRYSIDNEDVSYDFSQELYDFSQNYVSQIYVNLSQIYVFCFYMIILFCDKNPLDIEKNFKTYISQLYMFRVPDENIENFDNNYIIFLINYVYTLYTNLTDEDKKNFHYLRYFVDGKVDYIEQEQNIGDNVYAEEEMEAKEEMKEY